MAKVTTLVDDLDSKLEADHGTVQFGFEGTQYEIDLSTTSYDKFRKALSPFLKAASEVEMVTPRGNVTRIDNEEIRAWALSMGHAVAPKGRIKQTIIDAYDLWKATLKPGE